MNDTPHWATVSPNGPWFQANCTCGWTSTARTQARTAEDDAASHGKHTGHLLAVSR